MTRRAATHLLVAATLAVVAAEAQEHVGDWTPPSPPDMPRQSDWMQTTSGEWLTGELLVMYTDELTFDSDEFDEVTIDWRDVQQIRTANTMSVGLTERRIAVGRLLVDGDTVHVIGDDDLTFSKGEIVSITSGAPREIDLWDFDVAVGINYRTGNTDSTETTSTARLRRRSPRTRLVFDWFGTYNITDDVVASDNQRASGTWDRFRSRRLFWTPLFVEWYRDPFQNIASKYAVSVAVGYTIVDTPSIEWQVSGGPGVAFTEFSDTPAGEPVNESDATVVIGTVLDSALTRRIDLVFDYRGTFTSAASGGYLHHMITTFEIELVRRLDLDIVWVWDRIQKPRAGADGVVPARDDHRMSLLLGLSF